jgi:hypothetical protein
MRVCATADMFRSEEAYKAFLNGEDGWDWHYNVSRNIWGYGDDGRDWTSIDEEFIDQSEIVSIDPDKDGFTIFYEPYEPEKEANELDY